MKDSVANNEMQKYFEVPKDGYFEMPPPFYENKERYMAKLTPSKRDELLIRLDERVKDMREDSLPKIEKHLADINNHLDDHSKRITITETLQKERNKPSKKSMAGWVSGAVAIAVALWKAFTGG